MINSLFPSVAWRSLATVASFLSSPAARRLRGGEETAGAGKEAERRYEPPTWKSERIIPSPSGSPLADRRFHLLTWFSLERPTGRRDQREWPSDALEFALAVSRARARPRETCLVRSKAEGESRRPARRGVTNVSPRRGKENDSPRPPVSDEGSDRRQAGHLGAGERSVRGFMRSRSRPQKSPRPGSRSTATSAGFRANGKYLLPEGRACRHAAVVRRDPEAGREPLGCGRARV
jgi:hypothetical protein